MGTTNTQHPRSSDVEQAPKAQSAYEVNPSGIAVGLAVSMAWQLAIAVLVPVFGGHVLDSHLHSGYTWTIIGFVVAMLAMIVIVRQTLTQLNASMQPIPKASKTNKKGTSQT